MLDVRLLSIAVVMSWVTLPMAALADIKVEMEIASSSQWFQFKKIQLPAVNDIGAKAKWSVLSGRLDDNSGQTSVLSDGKIPASEDSPRENCFLAEGTTSGVLLADLGAQTEINQVATYSWHSDSRAPQHYRLYAATGLDDDFSSSTVDAQNPTAGGWKLLAEVDTRAKSRRGGQHAASITNGQAVLGKFRYLRFDVQATDPNDRFSHTFFSEVDILSANDLDLQRIAAPELKTLEFASADDQFQFVIDATDAPDLLDWSESQLKPVIQEWYPKIVHMLPSDNFVAPNEVTFRFLPEERMRGIPAWAQGSSVSMNANWFRTQLQGEARGAVVHEMVHIVQNYAVAAGRNRRQGAAPGWLVEGIPDYIRWFLYEPESKGALLDKQALAAARHDASYRVSANFIDYVIRKHDPQGKLLTQLNSALRQGNYTTATWQQLTGKSEAELARLWQSQ